MKSKEKKITFIYDRFLEKMKAINAVYESRYALEYQTPEDILKLNEWHDGEIQKAQKKFLEDIKGIF